MLLRRSMLNTIELPSPRPRSGGVCWRFCACLRRRQLRRQDRPLTAATCAGANNTPMGYLRRPGRLGLLGSELASCRHPQVTVAADGLPTRRRPSCHSRQARTPGVAAARWYRPDSCDILMGPIMTAWVKGMRFGSQLARWQMCGGCACHWLSAVGPCDQ